MRALQSLLFLSANQFLQDSIWLVHIDLEELKLVVSRKNKQQVAFLVVIALQTALIALLREACRAKELDLSDLTRVSLTLVHF